MSNHYEDWADWAGDHPQQAEADLRAEREKAYRAHGIKIGDSAWGAGVIIEDDCELEGHEWHFGVCLICEEVVEDFEPTDGQIPGTYEIRKAAA